MGLRDSLKALGLDAAGAAFELAQYGINRVQDFQKADQSPKGDGEGDKSKDDTTGGGMVPSDKDLAIEDPKAMFWDPFAIIEQLGFKERPTQVTYGTLRSIMFRMPVITDIIQTRLRQLEQFARPQHDRYSMGFRIKTRDTESTPKAKDKKWVKAMENLIMHTGVHDDPRQRDNFKNFILKTMKDSLIYDQLCFEIVPNRKGTPAQWYAIDASTIRIADTSSAYQKKKLRDDTKYVQIYDGMIVSEYTEDELCFGIRNPSSDIRLYGYGTAELEMIMSTITNLLYAWQYNQKFFTQGSSAKGILNFKGTVPEHQLKGFRRHWYNQLSSVENAWRTPITNADDLQWIDMQSSARDQEFVAWMDFQIKVACAAFQMNPVEINFQYGNSGQKNSLNAESNKEKVSESQVRGLRPLLTFLAENINTHILWPINENFEFEFVGLDAGTQEQTATLNKTRVTTTRTVDELRAEDDLAPLPDGLGEIILDPTWLQWAQAQQQAEQQEAMGGQGGYGQEDQGPPDIDEDQAKEEANKFDFESLFGESQDEGQPAEKSLRKSLKAPLIDIEL